MAPVKCWQLKSEFFQCFAFNVSPNRWCFANEPLVNSERQISSTFFNLKCPFHSSGSEKGLNILKIWLCTLTCSNESRTGEVFIKAKETKKASYAVFPCFVRLTVLNSGRKSRMFSTVPCVSCIFGSLPRCLLRQGQCVFLPEGMNKNYREKIAMQWGSNFKSHQNTYLYTTVFQYEMQ